MSNDDRDHPDFGEFDLPDEMFEPGGQTAQPTDDFMEPIAEAPQAAESLEPLGDDALTEEFAGAAAGGLAQEAGEEEAEEAKGKKKRKKAKAKKEKKEKPGKEKKAGQGDLVQSILNASPYTVMLAVSLAAILLACLCLFIELGNYERDIKAQDAKQRVSVALPFHPAPPSSTAAA